MTCVLLIGPVVSLSMDLLEHMRRLFSEQLELRHRQEACAQCAGLRHREEEIESELRSLVLGYVCSLVGIVLTVGCGDSAAVVGAPGEGDAEIVSNGDGGVGFDGAVGPGLDGAVPPGLDGAPKNGG